MSNVKKKETINFKITKQQGLCLFCKIVFTLQMLDSFGQPFPSSVSNSSLISMV